MICDQGAFIGAWLLLGVEVTHGNTSRYHLLVELRIDKILGDLKLHHRYYARQLGETFKHEANLFLPQLLNFVLVVLELTDKLLHIDVFCVKVLILQILWLQVFLLYVLLTDLIL